jgi:hypothetical protein
VCPGPASSRRPPCGDAPERRLKPHASSWAPRYRPVAVLRLDLDKISSALLLTEERRDGGAKIRSRCLWRSPRSKRALISLDKTPKTPPKHVLIDITFNIAQSPNPHRQQRQPSSRPHRPHSGDCPAVALHTYSHASRCRSPSSPLGTTASRPALSQPILWCVRSAASHPVRRTPFDPLPTIPSSHSGRWRLIGGVGMRCIPVFQEQCDPDASC